MTDAARRPDGRAVLIAELADLDADEALGIEDRRTVVLDQQSVGRLGHMDAIQRQAMAKAQTARRGARQQRIAAAIARLDNDEFAYCVGCGETIPDARLDLDPTVSKCIGCASA